MPPVDTKAQASLLTTLRRRLRAVADPRRAAPMRAYMRSTMPFHGVPTPLRRSVTAALWRERAPADAAAWRTQVAALWDGATHREERYAALDWCRLAEAPDRRQGRERWAFITIEALPLVARMITTGAWWDVVDELASHQLGVLLRKHPARLGATLRTWADGGDLWRRRAAIISQLNLKAATDTGLLEDCIAPSWIPSPYAREFFIAKGIGWALRQHARTDQAWVRRYLRDHHDRLPALSRREAAKHLGGKGCRS